MPRHLYRILFSGALVATMAVSAQAQTSQLPDADQDHDGAVSGGVCGTFIFNDGKEREALANTARTNPEFYRQIVERSKAPAHRSIQSSDDAVVLPFFMRNRV